MVSVLYLYGTDIGVWWHVVSVTLAGKLPKCIQLNVSILPAIA